MSWLNLFYIHIRDKNKYNYIQETSIDSLRRESIYSVSIYVNFCFDIKNERKKDRNNLIRNDKGVSKKKVVEKILIQ